MNNTTSPPQTFPNLSEITFTVFMILISLIGAVGNTFVIVAVLVNKKLRSTTNILILNLSVADFFVCFVAIPLRVLAGIVRGLLSFIECPFILSLTIFFDGASRVNTLLIALDRFGAIKWPFLYISVVTKRALSWVVFLCWTIMLNIGLLPLFGVGLKTKPSTSTMCFFFNNLSTEFICLFVFAFCIFPLMLIIPINCFLFRTSFKQMKKIHEQKLSLGIINPACTAVKENSNGNIEKENQKITSNSKASTSLRVLVKQSRVAKMVTILIASFIILVTPISMIDLIQTFYPEVDIPPYVSKIAVGMIYLNSAINVFIYAGYNLEFRKTFYFMFRRTREQFSSEVGPSSVSGVRFTKTGSKDGEKNNVQLLSFKTIPNL
ncbi:adenosine receptor A3-like [Actinia tenebrosa]|uniref:Adenosine receptor A3-like n=1 Tax=Actinia tenebrosa TaxID=6105 RepID=A0A6P8HGH6_ACTTE|nr:adenosine receptor A3-like [Actinia tenebrosa]